MTMSSSGRPHASPASRFARTRSREVPERYSGRLWRISTTEPKVSSSSEMLVPATTPRSVMNQRTARSRTRWLSRRTVNHASSGVFGGSSRCSLDAVPSSKSSRATMKARATESIPTLNSSITRYAKVIPPMLTSSLATRVQMISLRSGCESRC